MTKANGPIDGESAPPVPPPSQPVGFIVANMQPTGQIAYELRWTSAVVDPVQFCFLVIQVALNTAGILYGQKQAHSILIPQIQLPPNAKLKRDD